MLIIIFPIEIVWNSLLGALGVSPSLGQTHMWRNYHQLPIKTQTTSLFWGPSYSAYSHAGHRRGPNTPLWAPRTIHCWTSLQQPTLLHSHGSRKLGGAVFGRQIVVEMSKIEFEPFSFSTADDVVWWCLAGINILHVWKDLEGCLFLILIGMAGGFREATWATLWNCSEVCYLLSDILDNLVWLSSLTALCFYFAECCDLWHPGRDPKLAFTHMMCPRRFCDSEAEMSRTWPSNLTNSEHCNLRWNTLQSDKLHW